MTLNMMKFEGVRLGFMKITEAPLSTC